jgi:hypothetical protein
MARSRRHHSDAGVRLRCVVSADLGLRWPGRIDILHLRPGRQPPDSDSGRRRHHLRLRRPWALAGASGNRQPWAAIRSRTSRASDSTTRRRVRKTRSGVSRYLMPRTPAFWWTARGRCGRLFRHTIGTGGGADNGHTLSLVASRRPLRAPCLLNLRLGAAPGTDPDPRA